MSDTPGRLGRGFWDGDHATMENILSARRSLIVITLRYLEDDRLAEFCFLWSW